MTLAQFIADNNLTVKINHADSNPNMPDSSHMSRHFVCYLGSDAIGYVPFPFSQGSAHTDEPTAKDLIECLAADSASIENSQDFEDWASELGYEIDSRKAYNTWETCKAQASDLKALLGDEAYQTLLFEIDED